MRKISSFQIRQYGYQNVNNFIISPNLKIWFEIEKKCTNKELFLKTSKKQFFDNYFLVNCFFSILSSDLDSA